MPSSYDLKNHSRVLFTAALTALSTSSALGSDGSRPLAIGSAPSGTPAVSSPVANNKGSAQDAQGGEEIQPEVGPFVRSGADPYYLVVSTVLLPEGLERFCQMVILPAFGTERAVFIRLEGNGEEGVVVVRTAKGDLWSPIRESHKKRQDGALDLNAKSLRDFLSRADSTIESKNAPIDATTVKLLSEVWRRMLLRVRYRPAEGGGTDGIDYHFAHQRRLNGRIWSPRPGSFGADFVAIGRSLIGYAQATQLKRDAAKEVLTSQAKALLLRLDAVEGTPPN